MLLDRPFTYGSVCSGIEAATVAWHPLGWRAAFYAEIDKFPSAVLAHHYPHVRNLSDFTKIRPDDHEPIDLLVGGTPCQSFSIAGLRGGLADDRGNLALEFLRLAQRARPRWLVWENVPGVLSSNGGRDFGAILGGMVECGYGIAYRVLDAQYVRVDSFRRAVPQRRRRVFVVGYLGDWRRAAAVLFERASLLGDSPPRRETGERPAPTISARPTGGGGLGTDFDCDGGLIAFGGNRTSGPVEVSAALQAHAGPAGRMDFASETFVALVPIAFDSKASGRNGFAVGEISPTLRAMGHKSTHQNAGGQVAIAIQERAISENPNAGPDGVGVSDDGAAYTLEARMVPQAVAFAENSRAEVRLEGGDGQVTAPLTTGGGKAGYSYPAIASAWAVRRLTPRECERLQGFPDDYTLIPWRGKQAPDGPRYKSLGNSMAVNVMRWIGRRIEMVERLNAKIERAA